MSSEKDSFVHLHVHTEYSMLDGAARVSQLTQETARLGMPAIAITDHGNNFGAYDFWSTAKKAGVKPIIGIEAYLTPGTKRSERTKVRWGNGGEEDVSGGGAFTHATMLAKDNAGMFNLFRMSSMAFLDGFYFRPRIDRELLQKYSKGVIATTGCVSGEVQTRLRLGQYQEARQAAAEFQDIFGKENYFAEIMDHGIAIERRTMTELIALAKDLSIPLVATNDLHYTFAEQAEAHDALLCLQTNATLDEPKRFRFDSQEFYLKSPKQMRELFADYPEACDNTLLIAEKCDVKFEHRELLPKFPVPEGETEASWFEKEVARGMNERYAGQVPDDRAKQAAYEVEVIKHMGFPGYFLVVADFIDWARRQGIRVGPGRGSAAGSIVAYALGITALDPIQHGLIFERFLNPDRVSLPDIDVDFDDRRRAEVIRYVTQKYGDDRVAQIVTFGTIKAKQALKDAARVLGLPYSVGEKLTKALPPSIFGREASLSDVLDKPQSGQDEEGNRYKEGAELRELIANDSDSEKVVDLARGLESLKRQWGVHAAGVIMSAVPLLDVIPIMKREDDGAIITQFDQPPCEALGLLKMDFLGLRNLTVLDDAIDNVQANRGETVVLEKLDLNEDENTYELLSRGDTLGVFQLDGAGMRSMLRILKPNEFEHISAAIALYRPGPMGMNTHTNYAQRKSGIQQAKPIHPELEQTLAEILDPTYGLIVYQEQVMAAAQKVAGFSLGQADLLRRAMGKKKKEELDKQYEDFSAGMQSNGYSGAAIKTLWDTLLPFADYAFNKSHSAGYGVLSYWTAYMKANYPAEYMAALLTSVGDSKDKLGVYLNECRRMNIRVLPPDVNQSVAAFTAVGNDIRFGLGAVRNVGYNVVEGIVAGRESGPYQSFGDFLRRAPAVVCNKRTIESLVKAGAFDSLGHTRRSLFVVHEEAVDAQAALKRNEAIGQVDLFGGVFEDLTPGVQVPDLAEWSKQEKLSLEREMLGLYVSDHPLSGREAQLLNAAELSLGEFVTSESLEEGSNVTLAGLITGVQHRVAKNSGNPYGIMTIEDFEAELTVMVMGKTYTQYRELIETDRLVQVRGRLSKRDDANSLHAHQIQIIEGGDEQVYTGPISIRIAERDANQDNLTQLNEILNASPGANEVIVTLESEDGLQQFKLRQKVRPTEDLKGELKALFGKSCLS